jgi:hypothetical protein
VTGPSGAPVSPAVHEQNGGREPLTGPTALPVRTETPAGEHRTPAVESENGHAAAPAPSQEPGATNGDHPAHPDQPALPRRAESSTAEPSGSGDRSVGLAPSSLSPDERRQRLSRFRTGLEQGRQHGGASPDASSEDEQR